MSKLSAVSQDLARAGFEQRASAELAVGRRSDLPAFIMDFTSLMPNKSPEPTAVGAVRSAVAVHAGRVGGGSAAMSKVKLKDVRGKFFRFSLVDWYSVGWGWLIVPMVSASAGRGAAESEPLARDRTGSQT